MTILQKLLMWIYNAVFCWNLLSDFDLDTLRSSWICISYDFVCNGNWSIKCISNCHHSNQICHFVLPFKELKLWFILQCLLKFIDLFHSFWWSHWPSCMLKKCNGCVILFVRCLLWFLLWKFITVYIKTCHWNISSNLSIVCFHNLFQ